MERSEKVRYPEAVMREEEANSSQCLLSLEIE